MLDTELPFRSNAGNSEAITEQLSSNDPGHISSQDRNDVPLDVTFDMLKNERRRHVLRYLLQQGGRTNLSDLAESLAAIENGKPEKLITSQERKRVYVGLYQCHLPKMDDANIITFDRNRGTVELGSNAVNLYKYLQESGHNHIGWEKYYASVSLLGGILLMGGLALGQLNFLSTLIISAFVIVGNSACAVVQWFSEDHSS